MLSRDRHTNYSDEELLDAFRKTGNKELLGALLQRYTMLLLGVAMKYLKDKDQAQDAVQQIFLKTLTHLPEGEIRNFKGWLYILMRNHCFQQLRDRTHKAPEEALLCVTENEAASKEEIAWKNYTLEQMNEAMTQLNVEQRTSLILFYLEKKSYEQIMEQTGFTFMQVKSYIQNGKRNLKVLLLKKLGSRLP